MTLAGVTNIAADAEASSLTFEGVIVAESSFANVELSPMNVELSLTNMELSLTDVELSLRNSAKRARLKAQHCIKSFVERGLPNCMRQTTSVSSDSRSRCYIRILYDMKGRDPYNSGA